MPKSTIQEEEGGGGVNKSLVFEYLIPKSKSLDFVNTSYFLHLPLKYFLEILILLIADNAMAAHAKKATALYLNSPSTTFEKYANKKWVERRDTFESKQNFIKRTSQDWKASPPEERQSFLSASQTNVHLMSIKNFFKSSSTKRTNQASKQKDQNPPMASGTTSEDIFSDKSIPSTQIELTANSSSAVDCRETFLTSKESVFIKKIFSEICSDSTASLEGILLNAKSAMQTITKLLNRTIGTFFLNLKLNI